MHVTAIIAAGGRGSRFGADRPKQLLALAGEPILKRSVDAFLRSAHVHDIIVALPDDLAAEPPAYLREAPKPVRVVSGGARRQDSVINAVGALTEATDLVVIHDAARPLVSDAVIARTIAAAHRDGAAIAALRAHDTVKRAHADGTIAQTLPRDEIFLAQTPQAFSVPVLKAALALAISGEGDTSRRWTGLADVTDEAVLAERAGYPVRLVEGDPRNLKITTADDLETAERLLSADRRAALRIGNGYDLHRLVPGRALVLGGVRVPFDKGLAGHSDADAICHAVTDAILGAAAVGDIGRHFPDDDPAWKDADSLVLLARAAAIVHEHGWAIGNVDVTAIAQRPRLLSYVDAMRVNLAHALGVDASQVSIKGKTNEGVDAIGAGDAIAVHAVALLYGSTR